ncbi:ATP-binding protein [Sphingobium sp. H39-3-25]|uniref:sensor histidine kinase n=1 Tax=Sphingobium arseniciresistens TaxID=3030834 RepID=UPI0023B99695|nr:ATP-binding protein [Sphingobium arseniciresistens]
MRLRSLRALTAAFLLAFLAVTTITGVGIYIATHRTIDRLVDQRIAEESYDLVASGARFDMTQLVDRIDRFSRTRDTGDLGVVLTDRNGRKIAGNIVIGRPLPVGFSPLYRKDGIEGLSTGRVLVRDIGGGLRLTIVAETEPFDHYNPARIRIYLVGFGSIIAVVLIATLVFAQTIRRRIVAMRQTVEAIIDGDMRSRVPLDGSGSAFDQQARAFNRMIDRINALMGQISNVSNDIAHELRTPLTRLHQRLGLLAARPEADALRDDLDGALSEANQLLAMFGALLRIAEIEGGARRAGFTQVDLAGLCRDIATMLEPVATERDQEISVEASQTTQIRGDPQLLSQLLVNLIENGLNHTPPGSHIILRLRNTADHALLTVSDNGPGIAQEARARALTRFGRVGEAARSSPGHGLGLPLADAIVRLHRGTMALEDAMPGLRVAIAFPLR